MDTSFNYLKTLAQLRAGVPEDDDSKNIIGG
jgi:hypothetical protein